mmetsp:Transcript_5/g.20  ORF Transcript_5/g.20 Transcript_5/m.20 type:complete len:129 (-) Transcript_5:1-387(-)
MTRRAVMHAWAPTVTLVAALCSDAARAQLATCINAPEWTDRDGYACSTYVAAQWCTADGLFGPGWATAWGDFGTYASGGLSAVEACCGCGGGAILPAVTTTPAVQCVDVPAYTDSDGFNCEAWEQHQW